MGFHRASTGAIVNLGQLLGRGGEGTVHAVLGAPKLVAKVYLKPPVAAKVEKLRLMIRGKSSGLLDVAAWPVDLLTDERGAVRGFLMGRISARQDAHRLYSPKSRRGTFPDADFRFVVRAATNLARAFAQIHRAGHVIGDVNHGNALIGKDGTAVLIDCDSIQVREQNRFFTCDVGTPLFTAPELQGKTFRGLRRTEASDRFGLAVLIFHLLFQGRHPFAGVYAEGEMPLERAIAESRFAYGAHAASLGMSAPPGTLDINTFGRPIARLFERAFAPPGGEQQRPSAIEWIEALQELEQELAACLRRPRHFHPRSGTCCWCAIEDKTGARLFGEVPATTVDHDAVTVQKLWETIEGIKPPAELTVPKYAEEESIVPAVQNSVGGFMEKFLSKVPQLIVVGIVAAAIMSSAMGAVGAIVIVASLGIAGTIVAKFIDAERTSATRRAIREELQEAITQWRVDSSASVFSAASSQLAKARLRIGELAEKKRKELDRLESRLEPAQRKVFLEKFEIEKARFLGVFRSDIVTLARHGITTAGGVRRHRRKLIEIIPEHARNELRAWADNCATQFKFDTRDQIYVADAWRIEGRYDRLRESLIEELRRGPELLVAKRDEVETARARAEDVLRRKADYLRQRQKNVKQ